MLYFVETFQFAIKMLWIQTVKYQWVSFKEGLHLMWMTITAFSYSLAHVIYCFVNLFELILIASVCNVELEMQSPIINLSQSLVF